MFDQCIFVGTGSRKWFNSIINKVGSSTEETDCNSCWGNTTADEWQDPIFPKHVIHTFRDVIAREIFGDAIGRPIPGDKKVGLEIL